MHGAEEIAADYALSDDRLKPRHDEWLAEAGTDEERDKLGRRYGGVTGFLRAGGLDEDDLALAAARLR